MNWTMDILETLIDFYLEDLFIMSLTCFMFHMLLNSMLQKILGYKHEVEIISCSKCLTFWLMLAVTFNPIFALSCSGVVMFISLLHEKLLSSIEIKI